METEKTTLKVNLDVLKACREQLGLSTKEAEDKLNIKTLEKIENGERQPTFNQVENLSKVYLVPSYVFYQHKLPEEFVFKISKPSFRSFSNKDNFDYKTKCVVHKVENLRETILDLREDLKDPVARFSSPKVDISQTQESAKAIRKWLACKDGDAFHYKDWKKRVEQKNIFVFETAKLSRWSKVPKESFRGLSIFHKTLPIIIINGSDSFKAKSFTLFHELAHILKKQTVFDEDHSDLNKRSEEEKLCDKFAGNVLMPYTQIEEYKNTNFDLNQIAKIAKKFKVSDYATLVRFFDEKLITLKKFSNLKNELKANYEEAQKQQDIKNKIKRIGRKMGSETLSQYGNIYAEAVLQAHYQKQITLYKARNMFDLKDSNHLTQIMNAV